MHKHASSQVGLVPLSKEDLDNQAVGLGEGTAVPTITVPMRTREGRVTGAEAQLVPLETQATSTGCVVDTFLHLAGVAELTQAPDQELVRREVRGVLASLKRPPSISKHADWQAAWNATAWSDREQEILWPAYVPERAAHEEENAHNGEYNTVCTPWHCPNSESVL